MRHLTTLAYSWAVRCFGREHVHDKQVRALRLAEEAIELCQAVGVPQDKVCALSGIVYSRPPGFFDQELGGVAMTAVVLMHACGLDFEGVLLTELDRVLAKPVEHFAERNKAKLDLGLTGSTGH